MRREYSVKIPDPVIEPKELSKLLKINIDILKEDITNHINDELKRFANEINLIKNEGNLS